MAIDWWTLGLQAINVAVLIWLLHRVFWRPVAAMIEQRRSGAQQMLADADTKRGQAAAALAEIERTRAGFAQERDAILAAARDAAEQAHAARLQAAAQDVAAMQAAAQAALAAERLAAEQAWTERAGRLGVDIAGRLAARLDGPAVRGAFLDWLLTEIRALPADARRGMADGGRLEAITAAPLDPAEQARASAAIGEALGGEARITFRTDPALIVGLELHAPHFVLRNSWHADLSRILTDLRHDQ